MSKKTGRQFQRDEVWEIATKYATSRYSHTNFEEEYQSTRSSFYTVLDRAVIENIVDSDTVDAMEKKAKYNAEAKAGGAAVGRTEKHYSYLKKKRKEYMLPKEDAIELTITYAESQDSKRYFCTQNYVTEQLINRTIKKTVVDNWVGDEIVQKLKSKSLKSNNTVSTAKFWEELETFRENNATSKDN